MSKIVSFISTGQGPRDDIMYEMIRHLSPEIQVREVGAFDDYKLEELDQFKPVGDEESTLSRARDLEMHEFTFKSTIEHVQKKIDEEVAAGTDMIVICCTSEFPHFTSAVPILDPYEVMHKLVVALKGETKVGAMFPFEPYAEMMAESWAKDGVEVIYKTVEAPVAIDPANIEFFRNAGIGMLVMDCIGYNYATKDYFAKELGVPVIHPRSMIISMVHDVLNIK